MVINMDDKDKRIHLSFFVFLFLNVFYGLVTDSYSYLFYSIFAMVISYFIIYQELFFLSIDNAKEFGKRFLNSPKIIGGYRNNLVEGNKGTNLHTEMEDNRDEDKRQPKERISKEDSENSDKRDVSPLYY